MDHKSKSEMKRVETLKGNLASDTSGTQPGTQATARIHSPLPWRACNHGECSCGQIWTEPADHPVAVVERGNWGDTYPTLDVQGPSLDMTVKAKMDMIVYGSIDPEVAKANAKYIVHAANSYPKLVAALLRAESAMTYSAATVSPGNRVSEGDKCSINAGRAESSYRQLHYGCEDVRALLRELGEL